MPVTDKGWFVAVVEGEAFELNTRKVSSSNVEWIGWPKSGANVMFVQFKGGGRYAYLDVSRQRAVAAAYHQSSGTYINKRIKPHHRCVPIRGL